MVLKIFLTLFGIFLALGSLEVVYRSFPELFKGKPAWSDRPAFYYTPPKFHQLQDYRYEREKPKGTFRICILGDSFTFGPNLQFDDTYPKRLERMLSANKKRFPVEVHNHGHPGYSTFDELKMMKRTISERPDVILVGMTLNDLQRAHFEEHDAAKRSMGPFKPSEFQKQLFQYWTSAGVVAKRWHNSSTHSAYSNYFFELFNDDDNWALFRGAIGQMKELADSNGIKFGVVLFPLFGLPLDESYPFLPIHRKVNKFFDQIEVNRFDLLKQFRFIPIDRLQTAPGLDSHPNEIGHRIAAEAIYRWLAREEMIPQQLQVAHRFRRRGDPIERGVDGSNLR
ncbi:MAG: SGNH/GDSL hydrolase family protein [Bdellovibrionales bacterium]|nr:SGNH/GDSL hydrolase family protein [Bdellovibrionales bacterium]